MCIFHGLKHPTGGWRKCNLPSVSQGSRSMRSYTPGSGFIPCVYPLGQKLSMVSLEFPGICSLLCPSQCIHLYFYDHLSTSESLKGKGGRAGEDADFSGDPSYGLLDSIGALAFGGLKHLLQLSLADPQLFEDTCRRSRFNSSAGQCGDHSLFRIDYKMLPTWFDPVPQLPGNPLKVFAGDIHPAFALRLPSSSSVVRHNSKASMILSTASCSVSPWEIAAGTSLQVTA